MLDENVENQDSLNTEETQDSNLEPEQVVVNEELIKAQELANNYKIRAEKAEQALKKAKTADKEKETPKNQENLSLKDIRALQDVHEDDEGELTDFAKFKGITIAEAKKNPIMVALLKTRTEERASAQVTNTNTARHTASPTTTSERLLTKVEKFEELSDEEARAAAKALVNRMKGQK